VNLVRAASGAINDKDKPLDHRENNQPAGRQVVDKLRPISTQTATLDVGNVGNQISWLAGTRVRTKDSMPTPIIPTDYVKPD